MEPFDVTFKRERRSLVLSVCVYVCVFERDSQTFKLLFQKTISQVYIIFIISTFNESYSFPLLSAK